MMKLRSSLNFVTSFIHSCNPPLNRAIFAEYPLANVWENRMAQGVSLFGRILPSETCRDS